MLPQKTSCPMSRQVIMRMIKPAISHTSSGIRSTRVHRHLKDGGQGLTGTGPFPLQAASRSRENRCTVWCCKGAHEFEDAATKNILSHVAPSHYAYDQACDISYSPACWIRISNIGNLRIRSNDPGDHTFNI